MTGQNVSAALGILGLSRKAGRLICGTPLVCKALGAKRPPSLVVVSAHASDNTKKKLRDKCAYYKVRLYEFGAETSEMSRALGGHAEVASCAILDEGLAGLFLSKVENN